MMHQLISLHFIHYTSWDSVNYIRLESLARIVPTRPFGFGAPVDFPFNNNMYCTTTFTCSCYIILAN